MVAYNKVDLPDSADYWDFVREYLVGEAGLDPGSLFPVSAVTGQGVKGECFVECFFSCVSFLV